MSSNCLVVGIAAVSSGLLLAILSGDRCPAQEMDVEKRVAELLTVLEHPEARSENLKQTVAAIEELTKIGGPAAPQLVEAVLTNSRTSEVGHTSGRILAEIGKPAFPAIRTKWADLNDGQRWRFMPVFEKHDRESVREYAWNCLDADGMVRYEAWHFMLRTRDPRAKERYFDLLAGWGDEHPGIRWSLLPGEKPIYDEKRENDILIDLLEPDSWVAKGEGQIPPAGEVPSWWPDGRPIIIGLLHQRKVERAAPSLLRILEEKGPGGGYLATVIIPILVDFGYKKAISELERIAASEPPSGRLDEHHPHGGGDVSLKYKDVRRLAADAIKQLKETTP